MTNLIEMLRHMRTESAWQREFDPVAPKPGELVPDFELRDIHGAHPVRLSAFRGSKPVARYSAVSPDHPSQEGP